MSGVDLLATVVGLVAGYWIVAMIMDARGSGTEAPTQGDDAAYGGDSADPGDQQTKYWKRAQDEELMRDNWFKILDVSEDASRDEIVSAYKRKILQYHPDKVDQMGIEIRELANAKSKQINSAYNYAIKRR